ncbi:hypothetical protein D3C72_966060 [compost metagenome]
MNQQWLTSLMAKGIEFMGDARETVKSQLEERGIRLSAADFAALLEDVSPKASHAALSYALDLVRPFSAGMGLRISHLADTHVEMVIPARTRNLSDTRVLHEGALVTAAIECAKILWMRHAPMGEFEISVTQLQSEFLKTQSDECRVRMELTESQRELVLAEIRQSREASSENSVKIFDSNDQAVAEIQITLKFRHTPALAGQTAGE